MKFIYRPIPDRFATRPGFRCPIDGISLIMPKLGDLRLRHQFNLF